MKEIKGEIDNSCRKENTLSWACHSCYLVYFCYDLCFRYASKEIKIMGSDLILCNIFYITKLSIVYGK